MAQGNLVLPTLADEQREAAKARIMTAAGLVLAARGLAATIDDVAEAAGVNRRTIFRHFTTRDALFAVVMAGLRRYAEQLPTPPPDADLRAWLGDMLTVMHRLNARNGRVLSDLLGPPPEGQSAELTAVAAECRDSRNRFATAVTELLWQGRGGPGPPPLWLADAIAVQLSGFTTQSLGADLGRSPDEVAQVSAKVIEAAVAAALTAAR